MRTTWTRRIPCVLTLSLSLASVATGAARAETDSALEAARAAFGEGIELEKAGDFEGALAKFEETLSVKATPQVRFHVALCHEKLGRFVEAIEGYELAAKQAESEGTAAEVAKRAPALAKELRARTPKLTVTAAGAAEIQIDAKTYAADDAKDVLVDPGPHVVIAIKGEKKVRKEISLEEGEDRTVTLQLGSGPLYDDPAELPRVPEVSVDPDPHKGRRTVGWILGGVGVASLATTGVFLLVRSSAISDLETACGPDMQCPTSAQGSLDRAQTFTTLSRVALGVSAVTLVTGAILIVTGARPNEPAKVGKVSPWAPQGSIGIGITGAF